MVNKLIIFLSCSLGLILNSVAWGDDDEGLGQSIQINTRLNAFIGKPSWLLVVRDVDQGQNYEYLFDIRTGRNFWVVFTYARNYLILASNLQFSPYSTNPYRVRFIHNFCHLESHGRIVRNESMTVNISGKLSPYEQTYRCDVMRYRDTKFTIVPQKCAQSLV